MFPGIDPKKMQAMMKQMGMAQTEIDANRVIIECDDKNIIIDNPSVVKINMQGQENFQISGDISEQEAESEEGVTEGAEPLAEQSEEDTSNEDIQTLIEKANCTEEQAKEALEKADGDLTEAMLSFG